MATRPSTAGEMKVGRYMIDPKTSEPCKIVSIDKSKPGKHGSAKARIVMIGLYNGRKRDFVGPVTTRLSVPVIDKRSALVTVITGDNAVQIMDNESYETFETALPNDEKVRTKLKTLYSEGKSVDVEYWVIMDKIIINAAREQSQ